MSATRVSAMVMRARLTLRPGQNGTKELVQQYGDRLIAVRYRYDDIRRRRLKTAEIIVDEKMLPKEGKPTVLVKIAYSETELRRQAKLHGGRWWPDKKLWELHLAVVERLELAERVVAEVPGADI